MKKYLLSFAMLFLGMSLFAQVSKRSSKAKDLSPIELQITRGGLVPDLGVNFYMKPNLLLRVDALHADNYFNDAANQVLVKRRVGAFLEMRKYKRNSAWFYSHGPAIGYEFSTGPETFTGHELQAGYNLGMGYRINKHFTAGTYISPYVGFNEGGVDYLHGRLFLGTLSNIYLAYRI